MDHVQKTMAKHTTCTTWYPVGFQAIDVPSPGHDTEDTLTIGVWYPCLESRGREGHVPDREAQVSQDAELLPGCRPLFVFSHGFTDSAVQGRYLAEPLAAQGWIVAAADHRDPYTRWRLQKGRNSHPNRRGIREAVVRITRSTPADRARYAYRMDEMADALQGVLTAEPFASSISADKIAVGGHSFGGFTALGLCGTIPKRFDPRIQAAILLSSNSSGLLYTPEERSSVCMPVMLCTGEKERNNLIGSRRVAEWADAIFADLPSPKYFLEVKGATHASFSAGLEDESDPELARAVASSHKVISNYVSAFLHTHILDASQAKKGLHGRHPLLTQYTES